MIPKQEKVEVFSNSTDEKQFSIVASREAFRILSSGLYSNKPQAIIRELSCNAYDSHVMAGYPERPFKVHLPDAWEPFLSIEDFGIGLDDDDINNIYTSYFASTKTTSNDVIGGLGLGSKTPFSYTDTFTIRTRKDSVERVYNAFISAAGTPTTSLMSEVDTTEPNGVLITVPVRSQDFYDFEREANKVYKYFRTKPDGWDGDNSIIDKLDEGKGLIVDTYSRSNVTAIMGNVAYSIKVDETIIPRDKKRAWAFLDKASLTVRFEIGDLSVAASRETISFDDETKEFFIDKIENIAEEYYKSFQEEVNNCSNVFEALLSAEASVGEWSWGMMDYRGLSLADWAAKNALDDIRLIIDPNGDYGNGELGILSRSNSWNNQLSTNVLKDKWGNHRVTYKTLRSFNNKIIFFMDDTDHGRTFDTTSRAYIRSTSEKYLITIPFVLSDEQIEKLEELLGTSFSHTVTLTAAKDKFKVIREKQKVASGPRKDPVARAKKNEIRLEYWKNNVDKNTIHEKRLLDIDELSSLRVGHIVMERGTYSNSILGEVEEVDANSLIRLCKIFKLDYIVLTRPSQSEKVRERMPFLLELEDFDLKDVKDNEAAFLYSAASMLFTSVNDLSKIIKDSRFQETLDNKIFLAHFKRSNTDKAIAAASAIGRLEIPEIVEEVLSHEFIKKIQGALSVFNETELYLSSNIRLIQNNPVYNPWKVIYENYVKSIAEFLYSRNERIVEKYPLISRLHAEIMYDYDGDNNKAIISEINEYIQLIHEKSLKAPVEEILVEEELYEEVA